MNTCTISDNVINEIIENSTVRYSEREKAIRVQFVKEYLIDYDEINAAVRCGFARTFAEEYAKNFMEEVFVQQLIAEGKNRIDVDGLMDSKEVKSQILHALLREANQFGKGASHSARVAALGKLVDVYGLDAPKKIEQTNIHKGGVMVIPGAQMSLEEYERMALQQQTALVQDASA